MSAIDEAVETVTQMALAHGLVDNIMEEISSPDQALDLVNRLLLANVIDTSQAVGFIQLLTFRDGSHRMSI